MNEPQSDTPSYGNHPETDKFMTLIDDSAVDLGQITAKLGDFESERDAARRELSTEREAKVEYLRRDAERNRQLVAEREARVNLTNYNADLEQANRALQTINYESGMSWVKAQNELTDLRAKLASMERHMELARSEAGCPDDETLVIHCQQLRAELDALRVERDNLKGVAGMLGIAERDMQSLRAEVERLTKALGNCYMMACRRGRGVATPENADWQHIKRFCEETGMRSQILRAALPTEITDGEEPHETPQCNAMMERQYVEGNYARGPWMTLAYKIEKQFMETSAELATLRAAREQDHGAAIEAAVDKCLCAAILSRKAERKPNISNILRALVSTVTNSQQKEGEADIRTMTCGHCGKLLDLCECHLRSTPVPTSHPEGAATTESISAFGIRRFQEQAATSQFTRKEGDGAPNALDLIRAKGAATPEWTLVFTRTHILCRNNPCT